MAKEMGLGRALIEFWKLVFLVPPNDHPHARHHPHDSQVDESTLSAHLTESISKDIFHMVSRLIMKIILMINTKLIQTKKKICMVNTKKTSMGNNKLIFHLQPRPAGHPKPHPHPPHPHPSLHKGRATDGEAGVLANQVLSLENVSHFPSIAIFLNCLLVQSGRWQKLLPSTSLQVHGGTQTY